MVGSGEGGGGGGQGREGAKQNRTLLLLLLSLGFLQKITYRNVINSHFVVAIVDQLLKILIGRHSSVNVSVDKIFVNLIIATCF